MTGVEINQLQDLNAWVSLATALSCFIFVLTYALLARWWTSYEGRVMMGKAVAIGLLMVYTFLVVVVVPESAFLRGARIVLVAALGVFMLFQTAALIRRQLKPNDTDETDCEKGDSND